MHKHKVIAAAFGAFGIGYFVGVMHQSQYTKKRMRKSQPLITSALVNIMEKFQNDEMTYEEIREYAAVELNFIQMMLRGDV